MNPLEHAASAAPEVSSAIYRRGMNAINITSDPSTAALAAPDLSPVIHRRLTDSRICPRRVATIELQSCYDIAPELFPSL